MAGQAPAAVVSGEEFALISHNRPLANSRWTVLLLPPLPAPLLLRLRGFADQSLQDIFGRSSRPGHCNLVLITETTTASAGAVIFPNASAAIGTPLTKRIPD